MKQNGAHVNQETLLPDAPPGEDTFEAFWRAYPPREGPNPRKPAEQEYRRQIKRGASPDDLLRAVQAFSAQTKRHDLHRTPYIPHARTWLHQERWRDMLESPEADAPFEPEAEETVGGFPISQLRRELDKQRRGWPYNYTAIRVAKQYGLETKE